MGHGFYKSTPFKKQHMKVIIQDEIMSFLAPNSKLERGMTAPNPMLGQERPAPNFMLGSNTVIPNHPWVQSRAGPDSF
jgi:hypothetical protein